jgi:hypothetical protein
MLIIHQLEIVIEAKTPLALDAYCGSALRGAFFRAFWGRFCSNREAATCYECPLNAACPVSALVAPLRDEAPRGRDVPRPYILTPLHTGKERYASGEIYTFGFTLIGNASKFYPYVVRAFLEMESNTLGHPLQELQGKRGSFRLLKIDAVHPFTSQRVCLWRKGEKHPEKLQLGITTDDVSMRAKQLPQEALTLHFFSPTRLVAGERILRRPDLSVLVLRMAQRLEQILHEYGDVNGQQHDFGRHWYLSLKKQAEQTYLEHDETSWVELHSYSTRQRQKLSMSGFVGKASFTGPMTALHELLTWGELLRVGKHIVKGAGFYRIEV